MRYVVLTTLLLFLPAIARADEAPAKPRIKLEFLYLAVEGLPKEVPADAVRGAIERVPGVRSCTWTTPRREAKVVRVVGQAATATLLATVQRLGGKAAALDVRFVRLVFQRKLSCGGCVKKVGKALQAVKATKEFTVAEDKTHVTLVYDAKRATLKVYREALAKVGYPVR